MYYFIITLKICHIKRLSNYPHSNMFNYFYYFYSLRIIEELCVAGIQ